MTDVRNLALPEWRRLAANPAQRCLVPEWTPGRHDIGVGKPIKGEMWFDVPDQPVFAIAGFWQHSAQGPGFAMVTCDPNELVAPIHPKAMVTILEERNWAGWLTCPAKEVSAYQRPFPAERMRVRGPVFPTRTKADGAL